MKKQMKKQMILTLSSIVLALLLASCGIKTAARLETTPTLPATFTQQFTATGTYSDGSTANITTDAGLTWTSATTTVATISNAAGTKGVATALVAGTSVITATVGAVSGNTTLSSRELAFRRKWWRRGELNPCPTAVVPPALHA